MKDIFEWLTHHNIPYNSKELILNACVHTSYLNEHPNVLYDNERLEFMGDAVLQLWVSNQLFSHVPMLNEGEMTTLRSQLVREEALASYCRELGWGAFLLLGIGESKSGGRERDSLLADLFEAVIGAIFLDSGLKSASIILNKAIVPNIDAPKAENLMDYKTTLQEYIQADTRKTVTYHLVKSSGPNNAPLFEVEVKLDEIVLGKGEGTSKKKAEQQAAKDAFLKLAR